MNKSSYPKKKLKNIFIDGLKDHKTAQTLIREDVSNLQAALQRAIRDDLLQQTYRLRLIHNSGSDDRHIEDMDVDYLERNEQIHAHNPVTQDQLSELTASVAAIAAAVNKSHTPGNHDRRFNNPHHAVSTPHRYPSPRYNQNGPNRQRYINNNTSQNNHSNTYSHLPPLRWAENGDPICSHCNKQGHIRRQCWTMYPKLRPNNNNNNRAPAMGTSN